MVTSMAYVGTDSMWTDGQIMVGRQDAYINGTGNPGNSGSDLEADTSDTSTRTIRAWPKVENDGTITLPGWKNLYDQGLLVDGSRIRIPAGNNGTWYTVYTYLLANYSGHGPEILVLTSDFRGGDVYTSRSYTKGADGKYGCNTGAAGAAGQLNGDDDQDGAVDNPEEGASPYSDTGEDSNINAIASALSYELELKPSVLPNQEPLRLSGGIAIDLTSSRIPSSWYQVRSLPKGSPGPLKDQGWGWNPVMKTNAYFYNGWGEWWNKSTDPNNGANDIWLQYSPRMDIMFAPSGAVTGALATRGTLHLRLAETQDIVERRDPANPQAAPMLYCTLFTQTGYLATFNVNPTDILTNTTGAPPKDGLADDPLYFARTGGTAGR
ncbi:MAG: hypothetical protein V4719_11780 [Planctomycetota bacterium]